MTSLEFDCVTSNLSTGNFRQYIHRSCPLGNSLVISYTLIGYGSGIILCCQPNSFLNLLGFAVLTHSLVYSAYLSHEFMHGNIFKKRSWNELFGNLMLWLNGGCYYGFRALTEQHIAHHTERADVLTFDVPDEIKKQSKFIQSLIACSEWCYFPAVAFWVRWFKITAPWRDPEQESNRMRVGILVLVRASAFGLLIFFSVKAAFIYFLAYIGMITTLRFMDAFQHTYESFPPGSQLPKRDFFYEQNNTFSNLLSQKNKWLNLIFLGFGYHNAHHAVMTCPWHSLDQLNQELCSHEYVNYISFLEQLKNYHNFRVTRLFEGQGTAVKKSESWNFSYFHGSFDVSFITLY